MGRLEPAVVVCAAAIPNVERCELEPEEARAVNVAGTLALADAARAAGATFVFLSSEYVFDGEAGPYSEDDPVGPINEYGRQKVEVERTLAERGEDWIVARVSCVYGREARRKNFVYQLFDALSAGRELKVPSDQVGTPTAAANAATVIRELWAAGERGIFHVAGADRVLRSDFGTVVAEELGLDPKLLRRPRPPSSASPRPGRAAPDCSSTRLPRAPLPRSSGSARACGRCSPRLRSRSGRDGERRRGTAHEPSADARRDALGARDRAALRLLGDAERAQPRAARGGGITSFKRTVNANYFQFFPSDPRSEQFRAMLRYWLRRPARSVFSARLSDPSSFPALQRRVPLARRLKIGGYAFYVAVLWEYARRHETLGLLERLEEPELGGRSRSTISGAGSARTSATPRSSCRASPKASRATAPTPAW